MKQPQGEAVWQRLRVRPPSAFEASASASVRGEDGTESALSDPCRSSPCDGAGKTTGSHGSFAKPRTRIHAVAHPYIHNISAIGNLFFRLSSSSIRFISSDTSTCMSKASKAAWYAFSFATYCVFLFPRTTMSKHQSESQGTLISTKGGGVSRRPSTRPKQSLKDSL